MKNQLKDKKYNRCCGYVTNIIKHFRSWCQFLPEGHDGLAVTWWEVCTRAQLPVAASPSPNSLPALYFAFYFGGRTSFQCSEMQGSLPSIFTKRGNAIFALTSMSIENVWGNAHGEVINYCLRQGWEVEVEESLLLFYTILYQCSILPSDAILFSQKQEKKRTFNFRRKQEKYQF